MRPLPLLAATLIGLVAPTLAAAQDSGSWLVRMRAAHLDSADNDKSSLGLSVANKTMPELSLSYFWTANDAVEVAVTTPQSLSTYSSGFADNIGSFKLQSNTVLAQRHFTDVAWGLRPYLGAGLNFTQFSGVQLVSGGADLQRRSMGLALQLGADWHLGAGWQLNLDLKKLQMSTKVSLNAIEQGRYNLDPLLLSVGVGKRF